MAKAAWPPLPKTVGPAKCSALSRIPSLIYYVRASSLITQLANEVATFTGSAQTRMYNPFVFGASVHGLARRAKA
jgi:hypothetical protein